MKQVFVCVPTKGLTAEEAKEKQAEALAMAGAYLQSPEELVLMDTYVDPNYQYTQATEKEQEELRRRMNLEHLGRDIRIMATADIIVFGPGWTDSPICIAERECAVRFKKQVIDVTVA